MSRLMPALEWLESDCCSLEICRRFDEAGGGGTERGMWRRGGWLRRK